MPSKRPDRPRYVPPPKRKRPRSPSPPPSPPKAPPPRRKIDRGRWLGPIRLPTPSMEEQEEEEEEDNGARWEEYKGPVRWGGGGEWEPVRDIEPARDSPDRKHVDPDPEPLEVLQQGDVKDDSGREEKFREEEDVFGGLSPLNEAGDEEEPPILDEEKKGQIGDIRFGARERVWARDIQWRGDYEAKQLQQGAGMNVVEAQINRVIAEQKLGPDDYINVYLGGNNANTGNPWNYSRAMRVRDWTERPLAEIYEDWATSVSEEDSNFQNGGVSKCTISYAGGAGGGARVGFFASKKHNKALIPIYDHGTELCAAIAFVFGMNLYSTHTLLEGPPYLPKARNYLKTQESSTLRDFITFGKHQNFQSPTSYASTRLLQLAVQLVRDANLVEGKLNFEQVGQLSQYVSTQREKICRVQIFSNEMNLLYSNDQAEEKVDEWYFLLFQNGHYDFLQPDKVHALFTGFDNRGYCAKCKKVYGKEHVCASSCAICRSKENHSAEEKWVHCGECNRYFKQGDCFEYHLEQEQCQEVWKCNCSTLKKLKKKVFTTRGLLKRSKEEHVCDENFCFVCKEWISGGHICYMKPLELKPVKDRKLLFFDVECIQDDTVQVGNIEAKKHEVCLVYTCDHNGDFWPAHTNMKDWLAYLLDGDYEGYTIVAHNGGGYDFFVALEEIAKNQRLNVAITPRGGKIVTFTLTTGKTFNRSSSYRFIDSLNFISTPLSKFPDMFNLQTGDKGNIPIWFCTRSNQNYRGEIPALKYFILPVSATELAKVSEWYYEEFYGENPDLKKLSVYLNTSLEKGRALGMLSFLTWHVSFYGKTWDFQEELHKYCKQDVEILRRGTLLYADEIIEMTGVDPLECSTISSTSMKIFKTGHLEPNTMEYLTVEKDKWVRNAYYGGRVEPFSNYFESNNLETSWAEYVDFVSMFPFICATGQFPKGAHQFFANLDVTDEKEIEVWISKPGLSIMEVDVVCPADLHIPFLQSRRSGKLMFDLLPKRGASYTNLELQLAIRLGYKIRKIHSAMYWPEVMIGFMKSYVDLFFKMKNTAKAQGNAGKTAIAKIHLNGGYGKFGQRLSHLYTKNHILKDNETSIKLFRESLKKQTVKEFKVIDERTVLLSVQQPEPEPQTVASSQNVQYAVFVTAQARIKLFQEFLYPLGKRVLYCDTDSCTYIQQPGQWRPPQSSVLGGATSETGKLRIKQFASIGSKTWGYQTEDGETTAKMKGFPLKQLQGQLGYNELVKTAKNLHLETLVVYSSIRRHYPFGLDTRPVNKKFKSTFNKRALLQDGSSVPLTLGIYPLSPY